MRTGDVEITLREILVGVVIALLMTSIGFFISSTIHNSVTTENEAYFRALKVNNDPEVFNHGIDTSVGNMLAYGTIKANEPVSDPRIKGEFFAIKRIEEHYVQKTRTVTYTDSNGNTKTRVETYWEWEERDRETIHTKTFNFLGKDLDYDFVQFRNSSYEGTYKEKGTLSRVRHVFYTVPATFEGSLFVKAQDGDLKNPKAYPNKTIKKIMESKEESADTAVALFWVVWVLLTLAAVFGFAVLDNKYLNNREN